MKDSHPLRLLLSDHTEHGYIEDMNIRSHLEWALGLYNYSNDVPPPIIFEEFYVTTCEFLNSLGISPSHIGAEGGGHSGKLIKFNTKPGKRILESGFQGVSIFSIAACPQDSKEPAFDRLVSANLSWTAPSELLLCIAANDALAPFSGYNFDNLLKQLLKWRKWDFGYGLKDEVSRQPEIHVLAADTGRLSAHERDALSQWYRAPVAERMIRPRSVYPVNIWNHQQTSRLIGAQTLGAFIRSKSSTSIEEIEGLTIWKVNEAEVASLRGELSAKGALISMP